jgi:tetraacyldisaccharide 4'-kinase
MPVVSIGNLAMGGRGKTPLVASVARLLLAAGERPAILSRGYARRRPEAGVVIVSDGERIRADLDRSGDEPLLLARRLPGVPVLVCRVRARAAAVAETRLGATVHVLDDGFQHRSMRRDIDIVLVAPRDLRDRRIPFGRLRSPLESLAAADAVVIDGAHPASVKAALARVVDAGRTPMFALARTLGAPEWLEPDAMAGPVPTTARVLAVAGIASPARFRRALDAAGWAISGTLAFPDHHAYSPGDLRRIDRAFQRTGADLVVTTDKDAMRLLPLRPLPWMAAAVPLLATAEPADHFRDWLLGRLSAWRREPLR